jgi:cytochrome c peroxidase
MVLLKNHLFTFYFMKNLYFFLYLILLLASCKKEEIIPSNGFKLEIPKGFPQPSIPENNQPTAERVEFGKKLFFDPILSRDSTISCASCHLQDKKFTDGLAISIGIDDRIGIRNAPTLLNVAYLPTIFWDGGVPNLEQQVLAPIESHFEMDFNLPDVVARLNSIEEYKTLSLMAYDQLPSIFSVTRAIACFERTLYSGMSKYDDYTYNNNKNALSDAEKRGMELFFGEEGDCFHCHGSFLFTDNSFKNNGLYNIYSDSGRARITLNQDDVGLFKVPSLRNCEKTAPYMHDGSFATLEEVVEHYNSGGKKHPNQSSILRPLFLSQEEKSDLVAFLKSLTDEK